MHWLDVVIGRSCIIRNPSYGETIAHLFMTRLYVELASGFTWRTCEIAACFLCFLETLCFKLLFKRSYAVPDAQLLDPLENAQRLK